MKASDLVDVPRVPNFLLMKASSLPVSIEAFTDTDLKEIGKLWTKELIALAHKKRSISKVSIK